MATGQRSQVQTAATTCESPACPASHSIDDVQGNSRVLQDHSGARQWCPDLSQSTSSQRQHELANTEIRTSISPTPVPERQIEHTR
jgi:hypothetical protein